MFSLFTNGYVLLSFILDFTFLNNITFFFFILLFMSSIYVCSFDQVIKKKHKYFAFSW